MRLSPDELARWRASRLGAAVERLERARLRELLGPIAGRAVLDVGCGDGDWLAELAAAGAAPVAGVDASAEMVAAARRRVPAADVRLARAEALPFRDAAFDAVTAVTLLCFVAGPAAAAREMARVVRPGGLVVVGALSRWSAWALRRRLGRRRARWRSARFRSPGDLRRLLAGAGLRVEAVRGAVFAPPSARAVEALAPVDRWLGDRLLFGAAFLAVAARRPRAPSASQIDT